MVPCRYSEINRHFVVVEQSQCFMGWWVFYSFQIKNKKYGIGRSKISIYCINSIEISTISTIETSNFNRESFERQMFERKAISTNHESMN